MNSVEQPLTGPVFCAVGANGMRAFSRDGSAWTNLKTDREGVLLRDVSFLNGRCLTAGKYGGENIAFTSLDGVAWERSSVPGQPYVTRIEVLYAADERFCVIVGEDGAIPGMMTTSDGKTWSPRLPILKERKPLRHDAHLRRVAFGNKRLVLVGDYGAKLARTMDTAIFSVAPQTQAKDTLIDLTFGNGFFVGGGLHGLRMRSSDGVDWTDRVVGEEGEHINSMLFVEGRFYGIGQGATYRSIDGSRWERLPNTNAPTIATFGKGVFLGAVWPGVIFQSLDGVTWKKVAELPHDVFGIHFGVLGKG